MSSTYRTVAKGPEVDETLFGSTGRRRVRRQDVDTTSIVISASDLRDIRKRVTVDDDNAGRSAAMIAAREERERKAKERKARMRQLEVEAKSKARRSDLEIEEEARQEAIREWAREKIDMNNDLVKMLSSLGKRAEIFTVRDRQCREKLEREAKAREYDVQMDLMMEADRVADIQRREAIEASKTAKRVEDRKVIEEQIRANELAKLLQEEAREQENIQMKQTIAKYQQEEFDAAVRRRKEVAAARVEVLAANEAAIERKRAARQAEIDAVQELIEYQEKKDAELKEREDREAALQLLKKEQQARLLASQERIMDNQNEIEDLRARRAFEEEERRQRAKERAKEEQRKKEQKELNEYRKWQADQRRMKEESKAEETKAEYEEALKYNRIWEARESAEKQARKKAAEEHRDALAVQVRELEDRRRRDRAVKFAEGEKLKREFAAERAKLEGIRDAMLKGMEAQGYDPRYFSEMRAVDLKTYLR